MFIPIKRACINCEGKYPNTFLGSSCPPCKAAYWKYQKYVVLAALMVGAIVVGSCVILVLY